MYARAALPNFKTDYFISKTINKLLNKNKQMKKLFTLLTLALLSIGSAWAQTYTNEASTVTWAFTSHSSLGSTNVPADAFLTTNFSYGTNLTDPTTFNTSGCTAGWAAQTLVYFKPIETVAKGAADNAANMLEWTITPATGITFTPENVSITACTAGGTGDPQITIYAVYSDDSQETVQAQTNPRRPDKTGQGDGPSVYSKTLENAVTGTFKVRAYLAGLTNTAKGMAVTNIVVTGKVSGTPVATTTYTITAATNNVSLGSASGTATVAENEEVTLTATPTAAGYFTKWQKDGVDFDGNTVNPLTVTATADATYTAIFAAKKAITFNKGEGTGTVPATAYVIGGEDYTVPETFFVFKADATLTGWNDGTNTYAPGDVISSVSDDINLTAVFADNTVALGDALATVNWNFARESGAPTITCENSETDYVQHTTISGTRFDAVMHINTLKNAIIDGSTGKVNNTSNADKAQVNKGTKFTIPVVKGSVITFNGTNGTAAAGDITFGGENGTVSGAVTTFMYGGATGTLDIIDTKGGFYPSRINVTYPAANVAITPAYDKSTYVTQQALDFSAVSPASLKAYVATAAAGGSVTLEAVTTVPAGTPLMLIGTAGTEYTVPVAASASEPAVNMFKAGDGTTTFNDESTTSYDYILFTDGKFYRIETGTAVPVGKAYLHCDSDPTAGTGAPSLSIDFGGTTGIDEVRGEMEDVRGEYYNLAGQRVANPAKGLYIVNGKKYMVK